MLINFFKKPLDTAHTLDNPVVKINRLFAENLEQMMAFQMHALKSYLGIGLNQMRAAAEITDVQSFQDFCRRQAQITQTVQYKMLNDLKIIADMNTRFKSEMELLKQAALQDTFRKAA